VGKNGSGAEQLITKVGRMEVGKNGKKKVRSFSFLKDFCSYSVLRKSHGFLFSKGI